VAIATVAVLGIPLSFLLFASLRGPPEFLPIEDGARWTLENFRYVYQDSALYSDIIPNTLIFAAGSVALSSTIALALAWYVERTSLRRPVLTRLLILAPMALPTPALAVAWIRLLGPNAGWINESARTALDLGMDSGPFNIFSMTGLIWCQGIAGVPVAYLLMAPAVRSVSCAMEDSAYAGGATPGKAFLRIGVPMMLPSLAGPVLIMALIALEQVDFPYILGPTAGINVLGTRMLWEVTSPIGLPNMGGTAALALLVLVLAIAGLSASNRLIQARHGPDALLVQRGHRMWLPPWMAGLMRTLLLGYVAVAALLPLAVLLVTSLGPTGETSASSGVKCCSEGFGYIFNDGRFWSATVNTVLVATCSAAIATLIGVGIALCSSESQAGLARMLDRFSVSSVGVPSLLAAFGVAIAFLSFPIGIYGTVGILIVAYSYRIALSTRMAKAGLSQIGPGLREAASVSGARWLRTQTRIILPLLAPGIVSSATLLFILGIKEFTIPLMLYSPENVVLSVLLLQLQQAGNTAAAAATGVVMTVLAMLGIAGLMYADHRLARGRGER
jgi:iron(III) transport system permease protein